MEDEKIYLYLFDETGKYIGKEEAELDDWQTKIKGSASYKCKANATFEEPEIKEGFTPYYESGEWKQVEDATLEDLKTEKANEAKVIFAEKRDAIRFIKLDSEKDITYGFDTASEDITNFMAAWKAAELSGSTMYKVWLNSEEKGVVVLTTDDFMNVFKVVRDSQFEAYAWLQSNLTKIENCTTKEELEKIILSAEEGVE